MEVPQSKLDKIMRQVEVMRRIADDERAEPGERQAMAQKAEALMFQYKITELTSPETASTTRPIYRQVEILGTASEYDMHYRRIAVYAMDHCGLRGHMSREFTEDHRYVLIAHVVGFESDVRYFQVLYTAAALSFAGKLEPKHNTSLSDGENAYMMRAAGWEGDRIARTLWGETSKSLRSKARRIAEAHARSIGETLDGLGKGLSPRVFRESYADEFTRTFWDRLWRLRSARGAESGGLVLANAGKAVEELYYETFPQRRPRTVDDSHELGSRGGPGGTCERCNKAASGYCREHAWMKPSTAKPKEIPYSAAGAARGRVAAESIDLGPAGTGRVSESGRGMIG